VRRERFFCDPPLVGDSRQVSPFNGGDFKDLPVTSSRSGLRVIASQSSPFAPADIFFLIGAIAVGTIRHNRL
jgi:hypothetical protein